MPPSHADAVDIVPVLPDAVDMDKELATEVPLPVDAAQLGLSAPSSLSGASLSSNKEDDKMLAYASSDPAVLIEGLGFLSLPPAASGGPISAGVCSVEDHDGEEFASPLASSKGTVFDSEQVIAEPCCDLSAAAAAFDDEEGWTQVGRGCRSSRAPLSSLREGLDRSLAFKRWARRRCFRCLERGHQVNSCRGSFRCIRCRRPGHRERFCRARSPAARSRSPEARARSPVARAPCQRSRSPSAQPRRPSSPLSWAGVLGHSSLHPVVQPCCKDSISSVESQFALLRMEVLQKFELLRSEVQDALAKLQVASVVHLPPEIQTGSIDEGFECCFGEFSPRALHTSSSVLTTVVATEIIVGNHLWCFQLS
ncbi:hypothetical protein QYE76_008438 [Lolium multiflorum]|uniref:CCHC-type domain-containing protein n=1 Tax=Lolium multiflorum TaxID=4521 RepID=A0AAD8X098_LOLMU|nr:hypothetical protein QYE76_008438 [Lolium multiflorum]